MRTRRRQPQELLGQTQGPRAAGAAALTDRKGNLLWISAARPGRASEVTTARHNKLTEQLRKAGLGAIADRGFVGLDGDPDDPDDPDDPVIITGAKPPAADRSPRPESRPTS